MKRAGTVDEYIASGGKWQESLSLSRKREYADHVGSAKRDQTRVQRLEKVIPLIMEGIGMSDKYRK